MPFATLPEDPEVEALARAAELGVGYREAARRALDFARRYREEEGTPGGRRERECLAQAQVWRRAVHAVHAGAPLASLPSLPARADGPGLARATAPSTTTESERESTREGRKSG